MTMVLDNSSFLIYIAGLQFGGSLPLRLVAALRWAGRWRERTVEDAGKGPSRTPVPTVA